MKQINDPILGELEYDESRASWTKKINLGIWFDDDYQLDLVVKCGKEEEITDVQREAYKSYLEKLPNIESEFGEVLLSYYKDHYEDFDRKWFSSRKLNIDAIGSVDVLGYFNPIQLYINRNGDYGWKSGFISPDCLMSVVFSDDKIRIFNGWTVLNDYARVEDDVFGEMFFDLGWKKWIKTKYNRKEGEWLMVQADAERGEKISAEQKANYQNYLKNEKAFLEEASHVLFEYYLQNYEAIEEIFDIPEDFDKENIDLEGIMILVDFQRLYFNIDGVRYGWLCKCLWDDEGLAVYYDGEHDGICVGHKEDLIF